MLKVDYGQFWGWVSFIQDNFGKVACYFEGHFLILGWVGQKRCDFLKVGIRAKICHVASPWKKCGKEEGPFDGLLNSLIDSKVNKLILI